MSNISTVGHLTIFFISFKIKPDVTFIGFTTKNRILTLFWYQNCKNCKVELPIRIWIWLKYSWNLLMWKCDLLKNSHLLEFTWYYGVYRWLYFAWSMSNKALCKSGYYKGLSVLRFEYVVYCFLVHRFQFGYFTFKRARRLGLNNLFSWMRLIFLAILCKLSFS